MKKGDIFWGILLLTLGTLLLFRNLDIFNFSIRSLLRLWPLIFVFWGISVLPVKQGIKLILVGLTIIAGILILAFSPQRDYRWFDWSNNHGDLEYREESEDEEIPGEQNFAESFDSVVSNAKLNLTAAAGKFYIKNPTDKLFEFNNEGEDELYKISTRYEDTLAIIQIKHNKKIHTHNFDNSAWLSINRLPVWDVNIDVGAAEFEADLTSYKIKRIDIDGGASRIEMKIGSKFQRTEINIDAGASTIDIEIPRESACELRTNTFLSSRDIEGFNKISGGLYQTPNFSDSVNQIIIEVDAAVSSLNIKRVAEGI